MILICREFVVNEICLIMPVNSNFKKLLQQGSKPMTLQYWCDTLTN